MKRLYILITLLAVSTVCFAQQSKDDKNFEQISKKIQSEKIAYFTTELDLSPEEAQAFWPVYTQYQKESEQAHKATMKALWEATTIGKKSDATEEEIDKVLTAYNKAIKDEASLADKYYPQYKKILPASKIAKLYIAEESFKRVILNKFRHPGPQIQTSGRFR